MEGNFERTRRYYDRITDELRASEHRNEHLQARLSVVGRALDEVGSVHTALDVGCGNGRLALMLVERGISVTGIDSSPRSLAIAVSRFENASNPPAFILEDAARADTLGVYDLVTCTEVLEHVADPLAVLMAMRNAVKPGGHAVITVPNRFNLHGLAKWWKTRVLHRPWPVPKDDWFTYWSLRHMMRRAGWQVTWRSGAYFYPPEPLGRIYRGLERRSCFRWSIRLLELLAPWVWGLYCIAVAEASSES
jgi:2-polyprenyl-3-methyl-5-hydroxy-6-metoxy-1,4-benzoquinol methylase